MAHLRRATAWSLNADRTGGLASVSVRSGRARAGGLLGRARPGADTFSRIGRPDAERLSRRNRCGRGSGLPEKRPASRRELGLVPDHAGRDAIDIRNIRAAKPKRVRAAGLLLLVGVGSARLRPHRKCERRCEQQAELEISGPDSNHDPPEAMLYEVWVNDGGLASRRVRRSQAALEG